MQRRLKANELEKRISFLRVFVPSRESLSKTEQPQFFQRLRNIALVSINWSETFHFSREAAKARSRVK